MSNLTKTTWISHSSIRVLPTHEAEKACKVVITLTVCVADMSILTMCFQNACVQIMPKVAKGIPPDTQGIPPDTQPESHTLGMPLSSCFLHNLLAA